MKIQVLRAIASANNAIAADNRQLLKKQGVIAVNFMSSPGAGKTGIILRTIDGLRKKYSLAVIEGDIASTVDAKKIHQAGIPVVQINTGGNCSLEAHMVNSALQKFKLDETDLMLIENVGNLICPVNNDLGEDKKVVISSLPEGDDKPYKYPLIFSRADVVLLNKIDLAPYLEFDVAQFHKVVQGLNPSVKIFEVSAKTGKGIAAWVKWLEKLLKSSRP
jgi:hydrogenase nickel incorporation protein HypB